MHSAAFDGWAHKSAEGIYTTVVSYRLFLLREKEWKQNNDLIDVKLKGKRRREEGT